MSAMLRGNRQFNLHFKMDACTRWKEQRQQWLKGQESMIPNRHGNEEVQVYTGKRLFSNRGGKFCGQIGLNTQIAILQIMQVTKRTVVTLADNLRLPLTHCTWSWRTYAWTPWCPMANKYRVGLRIFRIKNTKTT